MKLLLVEDDFDLSGALTRVLRKRGFDVTHSNDGIEALALLRSDGFEAVILDLGIPGIDGLQLLQRLRGRGSTVPVLVLTARGSVGERVTGLNAGADDYLAKPFDLDELDARLRALVRRSRGLDDPRCGELRYERGSGAFYVKEQALELTRRESALLAALMAQPGHAVTRERLALLAFSDDALSQGEGLEVLVHRVRKKLVGTGAQVTTLRGLGYLLQEEKRAA
ncbi:MAG: response regulator [Burkholderiales bacterium]|nr:response regulator [Burkholderiales bacterium]